MAFSDALQEKIMKLGSKQKLGAVIKHINNPNDDVRMTVAMALGLIPTSNDYSSRNNSNTAHS